VMFDYALLHRPMIFHVPDLADYIGTRGAYFDLAQWAPGPLTRTDDELLAALADLPALSERYAEKHRAFVERFATYDSGNAAQTVVERYFTPEVRRG
jgi:CDP-glycerol glycerophosphotransferase